MIEQGRIAGINGPVITIRDSKKYQMLEMIFVGHLKLIGEVINIEGQDVIAQVYESTTGLGIGEPVYATGEPMSLELGPGIVGGVFDGIQRPLTTINDKSGTFIGRGLEVVALDRDVKWQVEIPVKVGDKLKSGDIYALVQETDLVMHKVMVGPNQSGKVIEVVNDGAYTIDQTIVKIMDKYEDIIELKLYQKWPVRQPRPFSSRKPLSKPLITGQRIIDSLFPIAKGGAAAIPGGFGTGKTMTQHQLAKWSDADIIVYIGCGERGNEITEVLEDFPKLIDPKSGRPLMERTILIANTSNMPVAAREASIYTGITIAEYYRDMGYHVAIMADSTSRWAEALREISGRLEEMPAEEGFPSYLPSRLSQFYERAGYVETLNGQEGSVSIIGAVSPQGGDFSEPVTQNTKRFIRCFWALDRQLAYSRHYPAIHWLNSYSEYMEGMASWYQENVSEDFLAIRQEVMALLQEESKLMDIVKLIGADILPEEQKLILEICSVLRLGFLQQNAFHDVDTYVPLGKQKEMMRVTLYTYEKSKELLEFGIPVSQMRKTGIYEELIKIKYTVGNDNLDAFEPIFARVDKIFTTLRESYKSFERVKNG
ncbi:V-type ATP synthase subunit A [Petrocella sp. FN5]|uniref:V-type ATP synthase subunit A n=1 Tax=Petrocella sp. FN5 TaxID=3032002 RepID=UPI0023D9F538|nr:V-type ATP synthase subunit A [Petrocella sp. FN5]MDF1616716.1 V-type ATP synthase subunit A [Petrocella sp. FN5]